MKKESYTKKLNQLALEIKDVKSALKSDIDGTIYGIERYGYIQISYNQVENDNYYYITVNDRLSYYYYTLTFKNGKILMAQRTELKFNNKEFTTTITINTFDKHFRNMIKNILKDVKTEKSLIDSRNKKAQKSDQVVALNVNNDNSDHLSIQIQEGDLNMNNQEGDNNMTTEQFKNYYNQLSYDEIKEEAKKLDLNECLEFISELIFDYDIGLGLTYDQIQSIYENYLNESDIKEFCFKMKYYNEEELETELIIDQLELFNLNLLTTDQIYIYENAEEFIDMYIDNYGQEVREFYDRVIRYVINESELYDYLTQYYDFIKTESGQILEIIY